VDPGSEFIGHGKSLFDSRPKFPAQMKQGSLFHLSGKVSRPVATKEMCHLGGKRCRWN
jgi:hypothetical protein